MHLRQYWQHLGLFIGVLLLGGIISATSSEAATYYVAPTGNNANPGTQAQPFRTLGYGVTKLTPGDTLYVRAGLYQESVEYTRMTIPSGTSWSAPVTISAYPGETVTIRPAAGSGASRVFDFGDTNQYIILNGLVLDGVNAASDVIKFSSTSLTSGPHHIRIRNSELKNGFYTGIQWGGHHNEILNSNVHHNGQNDFDHGLYISGPYNLVEGCDIHHNAGWGIHLYSGGEPEHTHDNIIRNNKSHDNATAGARGAGILIGSGNNNAAYNNVVWNNADGLQVYIGDNNRFYNNTVYGSTGTSGYGRCVAVTGTNSIIRNNICYQNAVDAVVDDGASGTLTGNNLTINPKFVNAASFDFHLQAGSPAINAGLTLSVVATDYAGTPRPQGAGYDIGAYEYGNSTPAPTKPTNFHIAQQ
jgi:parallel beta-helix repeat protein